MKKLALVMIACLIASGWGIPAYCQDGSGSDAAMESGIDQEESAMDSNLSSEMGQEEAEGAADVADMDASMDSGGETN